MAFGTFTLTGHFDQYGGNPAAGPVRIDGIPQVIVDPAGNTFKIGPKTVVVNTTGDFSIALPSDSASGDSTGIGYSVTVKMKGLTTFATTFYARQIGTSVDLADVTPEDISVIYPSGAAADAAAASAAAAAASATAAALSASHANDAFLVEEGGVYPARPWDDPVIFVGEDDPSASMLVGDTWINTTPPVVGPSPYMLTTARGAANGVAPLDSGSRVPEVNLPAGLAAATLSTVYTLAATRGAANGVAPLDSGSRVPEANLPAILAAATLATTYVSPKSVQTFTAGEKTQARANIGSPSSQQATGLGAAMALVFGG